ncbi:MAG: hypothetical protein ACI857_003271, partial [Arenicella sp.]
LSERRCIEGGVKSAAAITQPRILLLRTFILKARASNFL